MFNSSKLCATVAGKIVQQSQARFFNSQWHDSPTVTGITLQQSLARLFNSGSHNSSTVTGIILQHSLARSINSGLHNSSTVTGKIFSFFYAGRIFQQWCSLSRGFFFLKKTFFTRTWSFFHECQITHLGVIHLLQKSLKPCKLP